MIALRHSFEQLTIQGGGFFVFLVGVILVGEVEVLGAGDQGTEKQNCGEEYADRRGLLGARIGADRCDKGQYATSHVRVLTDDKQMQK